MEKDVNRRLTNFRIEKYWPDDLPIVFITRTTMSVRHSFILFFFLLCNGKYKTIVQFKQKVKRKKFIYLRTYIDAYCRISLVSWFSDRFNHSVPPLSLRSLMNTGGHYLGYWSRIVSGIINCLQSVRETK